MNYLVHSFYCSCNKVRVTLPESELFMVCMSLKPNREIASENYRCWSN